MNEKLQILYQECIKELKTIGIDVENTDIGYIDISIAKRNAKRYGCCKQEEPDENYKEIKKIGRRKVIKYNKFNRHHIEISKWVMDLDDSIIKNTIIHELIHCMPFCNDHGKYFKKYARTVNEMLGYNITRVGNKEQDYKKSNVEFAEKKDCYNYEIICNGCGQKFFRQRINKYFKSRYRCGICGGKFEIYKI